MKKKVRFGELLTRLRNERGLRQRDVAAAADLALSTVSKQERSDTSSLRHANAARLAAYLHSVRPLAADDAAAFRDAVGLPADWHPAAWSPAPVGSLERAPIAPIAAGIVPAAPAPPGACRELVQQVHQAMLEEIGANKYLAMLLDMAARHGVSVPHP